jgi:hypothetical protein
MHQSTRNRKELRVDYDDYTCMYPILLMCIFASSASSTS